MNIKIKTFIYARIKRFAKPLFLWFKKHNWLVISLFALFLIFMERFEALHEKSPVEIPFPVPIPYHVLEITIYLGLVGLIGVLIDLLIRSILKKDHALKILEYKHKLSLELTKFEDWKALTAQMGKVPSTIAPVCESDLYARSPYSKQFELVTQWSDNGGNPKDDSNERRREVGKVFGLDFSFKPGQPRLMAVKSASAQNEFYYLINSSNVILGLIWFKLKPGEDLSVAQRDIFENIGDEIAIAFKAGDDHQRFSQLQMTEIALSERRSVSTYLHDHVSQNMAYLCLKLDQFTTNEKLVSDECLQTDLLRMREAANDSYEFVRNTIETIQPETMPHLSNLLFEHAAKVSRRANFEIAFENKGEPIPVSPNTQRAIFYVFQEILSNVEKHANANKVDVLMDWQDDSLSLAISDNGKGFNPDEVNGNKHFGLAIMEERIAKLDGWIKLETSGQMGTSVTLHVPLTHSKMSNEGIPR